MDQLTDIFQNLDRWRHLPAYQLERRADIFFSIYLAEVVEAVTGIPVHETILPELPLRKGVIWDDPDDNRSEKVDYVLFSADRQRVFLVELKTDLGSRRDRQDAYLDRARGVGFRAVVEGIVQLAYAARKHRTHMAKYLHLLRVLDGLGFVKLPDDLEAYVFAENRTGLTRKLEAITVASLDPPITILYVQPTRTGDDQQEIDFLTFAEVVERQEDPVSRMFAEYLRRWTWPAGARR